MTTVFKYLDRGINYCKDRNREKGGKYVLADTKAGGFVPVNITFDKVPEGWDVVWREGGN